METQKSIGKKTYSSSEVIPQLNSGRKSTTRRSLTQTGASEMTSEEFEAKLLDIDIRKPRSAFNFFMMNMQEKVGNEKNIVDITQELVKKWPKLTAKEKEKYETLAQEDKERYNEHIALVKKYIVAKPLNEAVTAITSRISGYTLFCKEKYKQNQSMTLVECAEAWDNTEQSVKDKYEQYAQEMQEEKEKNRDLYELAFNVKPKRPLGPYNFYLMELNKEGKFSGFKDAATSWHNLPPEEKEKYLKVAKKAQLAYAVKKQAEGKKEENVDDK
jgi:hypothetical protein